MGYLASAQYIRRGFVTVSLKKIQWIQIKTLVAKS